MPASSFAPAPGSPAHPTRLFLANTGHAVKREKNQMENTAGLQADINDLLQRGVTRLPALPAGLSSPIHYQNSHYLPSTYFQTPPRRGANAQAGRRGRAQDTQHRPLPGPWGSSGCKPLTPARADGDGGVTLPWSLCGLRAGVCLAVTSLTEQCPQPPLHFMQ